MSELVMVLVGAAVLLLWWRRVRPRVDPMGDLYALAVSDFGASAGSGTQATELHHWQPLGRFDFEIVDTERHQAVLRAALADIGALCRATLHAPREVGGRVEVRLGDHRVGFLSDGDASRFQRRLAYEGRPGQTSQCGARIVAGSAANRQPVTILLDLKPFRH
ncbi:hypothetical protein [Pseudorhodoferax sp. Leaf274]|uniref:hypothetical protein n=1 Tax=Pseudorhodoferax sp. Leaf274 TaxID=1736318 RepID=UPI000702DBF7|nr:hypothetical protein [Pseudorhodoferax sp. Leaf274]KQP38801.1 hypothetical protein ASF44_10155 [Pseudorhodoferax sp. Leaf274]